MVIDIKKSATKNEMKTVLAKLSSPKKLDAKRFVGTIKWGEDPIAYQKRLRDEW